MVTSISLAFEIRNQIRVEFPLAYTSNCRRYSQSTSLMELQTFDLGKFEGSSEDRLALYDQIREHFATFGFAKFVNHGIQDVVIDKAFQWVNNPTAQYHLNMQ